LTVLIVLTSATIAAMLLRVVVSAAANQQSRRAFEQASRTAQEIESRTRNQLARDPFTIFDEVLADEAPRRCDADLAAYPDPLPAGAAWPATCGTTWSYAGTGGVDEGVRILLPGSANPTVTIEVFARVGGEQVGYRTILTGGGPARPLLYGSGDVTLDDLRRGIGTVTVNAPVYVGGQLSPGVAVFDDDVTISAEEGFDTVPATGTLAVPSGVDGGEGALDIRALHSVPLASSNLGSSLSALRHVACLDPSPANVSTSSSSLCLTAGGSLRLVDGTLVALPSGASAYAAWLVIPAGDAMVRIYARTIVPVTYPGPLASWTLVGDAFIPGSGVIATDATTVVGHCAETNGACTDWTGDGQPGVTVDDHLTIVVGSIDNPADLHVGGPLLGGDGRLGVVVSGRVLVPSGATPAASSLDVALWAAAIGKPAQSTLASNGPDTRPALNWTGALLLERFTVDLGEFTTSSFTIRADTGNPPLFPVPGLNLLPVRSAVIDADDLAALFALGDAS